MYKLGVLFALKTSLSTTYDKALAETLSCACSYLYSKKSFPNDFVLKFKRSTGTMPRDCMMLDEFQVMDSPMVW